MHRVEHTSWLPASAAAAWERAVTEDGINDELRPFLKMTMPAGLRGKTVATVEVGVPLGRSWILLGRVVPIDYDDILIAELEPGRRFRERSRTLMFSVWQHERVIEPAGEGCRITDRLAFELKPPLASIPGMAAIATRTVRTLFRHRHARLERHHRKEREA